MTFPNIHLTCLTTAQVLERTTSAIECGRAFGQEFSVEEMIPYVIAAEIKYPNMGAM